MTCSSVTPCVEHVHFPRGGEKWDREWDIFFLKLENQSHATSKISLFSYTQGTELRHFGTVIVLLYSGNWHHVPRLDLKILQIFFFLFSASQGSNLRLPSHIWSKRSFQVSPTGLLLEDKLLVIFVTIQYIFDHWTRFNN